MWLVPVAALAITGVAAFAKATQLKPLPADVAAILRGGLQSKNTAQLTAVLNQLAPKYPRQVKVVQTAWTATKNRAGAANVPADVDAMYMNALGSGDPVQMETLAVQFDQTYHWLEKDLREVASLLANLKAKAA